MAAKFSITSQRGETHRVSPDDVIVGTNYSRWRRPTPQQIKQKQGELLAVGRQITPGICKKGEDGRPELVAGETRLEAIRELNRNLAPGQKPWLFEFIYDSGSDDEKAQSKACVLENAAVRGLSYMDWATALNHLLTVNNWTQAEAAEFIGRSQGFVSQHLALLRLDLKTQQALEDGKLTFVEALNMCGLSLEKREEIVDTISVPPVATPDGTPAARDPKELIAAARKEERETRGQKGSGRQLSIGGLRKVFDAVRREVPVYKTLLVSIEQAINGEYTAEELVEDFAEFYKGLCVEYHRALKDAGMLNASAKFLGAPQ